MAKVDKKFKSNEPTSLDPDNLNSSIVNVLSWYRENNINSTQLKEWMKEAADKMDMEDSESILKLSDNWITETWGYVARMYNNDVNLLNTHVYKLSEKLRFYIRKGQEEKVVKPSPVDRVKEITEDIVNSLDLDSPVFDIVDYVNRNVFTIGYVRQMIKKIDKEKYPDHIASLEGWLESNKKKRKPRKKKIKSDEDICKLFKYCTEHEGIKSILPTEILGKECVVVYHTQKKNITFYFGKKLTVSRSMIMGFDRKKSKQFEAKKETLKELNRSGKITIDKVYKEVYADVKEFVVPTGRVTDKMVLVGGY